MFWVFDTETSARNQSSAFCNKSVSNMLHMLPATPSRNLPKQDSRWNSMEFDGGFQHARFTGRRWSLLGHTFWPRHWDISVPCRFRQEMHDISHIKPCWCHWCSRLFGLHQFDNRCVWKCCVPLNPMVLLIIIPQKNGYNWEYTLFSDKPNNIEAIEQEWHGVLCCIQVLKLWQPARQLANTRGTWIPLQWLWLWAHNSCRCIASSKRKKGLVELPWTSIFWLHPKMVETAQTIQTVTIMIYSWLVVYLPLWKILEFVSWDYDIPNCFWKV